MKVERRKVEESPGLWQTRNRISPFGSGSTAMWAVRYLRGLCL